jgi:hypothetical protein
MDVQSFLDVLPEISEKGVTLSGGELPDNGIESIMSVDALVRRLARQAHSTLDHGKPFN